ncbi:Uncharacterised protein [Vibrio cholerae]|nr:Uncharacterised protein [Vibrio cholerae]
MISGFWPEMIAISDAAFSSSFLSLIASPTPILRVIFSILGTCMTLV